MKQNRLAAFCLIVWAATGMTAGADTHPFGIDDAAALRSARPIATSPDGASILYGVDFGGTRGTTNHEWYLIGFDGAAAESSICRSGSRRSGSRETAHRSTAPSR